MSFDLRIVNGDLKIENGRLAIVENTDKLQQDVLKLVSTPLGSNRFFPWYGSPISNTLVGQPYDDEFVSSMATSQLQTALSNLQKLQQEQSIRQRVSSSELIAAIKDISIERNQVDPRFFLINIKILSRDLTATSVEFNEGPSL